MKVGNVKTYNPNQTKVFVRDTICINYPYLIKIKNVGIGEDSTFGMVATHLCSLLSTKFYKNEVLTIPLNDTMVNHLERWGINEFKNKRFNTKELGYHNKNQLLLPIIKCYSDYVQRSYQNFPLGSYSTYDTALHFTVYLLFIDTNTEKIVHYSNISSGLRRWNIKRINRIIKRRLNKYVLKDFVVGI